MRKEGVIFVSLIFVVILLGVVSGANKIEITELKDLVTPGENLTFKILLYDSSNNIIPGQVAIHLEDAQKRLSIDEIVNANELSNIQINENAYSGNWRINAKSGDAEITSVFVVQGKEDVVYNLDGDILTITNNGNTVFEKVVEIVIGDSIGTKSVSLNPGESTNSRLTAPDGTYNIRVTVDGKDVLTKGNVALTGEVIGVFDKNSAGTSGITGVNPEKTTGTESLLSRNRIIYIFLAVIIGAAVLLAVERNYRKKAGY